MSEIVFNPSKPQDRPEADLRSQIENLQTTLASLNQQVILLREALQERDQEVIDLKAALAKYNQIKTGGSLTIIGILINLFRFIFWPRKE